METAHLKPRGFAGRYLTLFGGEAFSKACVMLAFAYLARTLGPRDFGIVELALSIALFFVLGVESGIGSYGARVVAADPTRVPRFVPAVMVIRISYGVLAYMGVLAVASANRVSGLGILAVNGLVVLFTPFFVQFVFQGLHQMQWVATGTAIRNFVFAGVVLLAIRPGSDLRLVAAAEVAGAAALAVYNMLILRRRLHVRLDWRDVLATTRTVYRDVWYLGVSDLTWACLWYAPAVVMGWIALGQPELVAWIGAAVRVVVALHTFVWLYFFNLLPSLSKELTIGIDAWRRLFVRSMESAIWPAGLIAVGGTFIAPVLIPVVYGAEYASAVVPFQIVVWMIPLTWFNGHYRYSLVAAGQQRWEAAASTVTAVATVVAAFALAPAFESRGAAVALVIGGLVNTVAAVKATTRYVGPVAVVASLRPVLTAMSVAVAAGIAGEMAAGPWVAATVASFAYLAFAFRHSSELLALARQLAGRPATRE